eukprot:1303769-Amorphochlora_amoeboformis.AAC.1
MDGLPVSTKVYIMLSYGSDKSETIRTLSAVLKFRLHLGIYTIVRDGPINELVFGLNGSH